jgi:hypothetical protein
MALTARAANNVVENLKKGIFKKWQRTKAKARSGF